MGVITVTTFIVHAYIIIYSWRTGQANQIGEPGISNSKSHFFISISGKAPPYKISCTTHIGFYYFLCFLLPVLQLVALAGRPGWVSLTRFSASRHRESRSPSDFRLFQLYLVGSFVIMTSWIPQGCPSDAITNWLTSNNNCVKPWPSMS